MEKVVKINGKDFTANFNAQNELSKSVPGVKDEVLINMKRSRYAGYAPYVLLGDKEVKLGYHFYTDAEKKVFKDYDKAHRGNGGGTHSSGLRISPEVLEALKKFQAGLEGTLKEELGSIIERIAPDPEIQKLMNMGFTLEQAKQALALKK